MEKSGQVKDATTDVASSDMATFDIDNGHLSSKGADEALMYVDAHATAIDPRAEKRVLRKIDWHVMPWLCSLYFLQFLDKQLLSYASVMGIQTYARLTSKQYSWLGSIYYLGYLVGEYPHNRLLQQFNQVKYLAICAVCWGTCLCFMAACKNFTGLMIVRALMGYFEGVVSPAFLLITAKWYKKYEHGSRVGWWAGCNGLASGLGGLIAYGCYKGTQHGEVSLPGWKVLALVAGLLTVIYGIGLFFIMADTPLKAGFLNEDEKHIAIERLRDNHQGVGSRQFKWYQFREAFTDYRTWLYVFFILVTQIPLAGTTLFSSLLIKSLEFPSGATLLLAMPGGAIQIISNPGWGYLADRFKNRSLAAAGAQLLSLFAISLQVGLASHSLLYHRYGQLVAYFIINGNGATSFFLCLSMVSSNTLGTTKKTTVNAIVFVTLAVSYLVGPQIFINPPYYTEAKIATLTLWAIGFLTMIVIWYVNRRENAKRDEAEAAGLIPTVDNVAFLDLTDKENKKFRYVL